MAFSLARVGTALAEEKILAVLFDLALMLLFPEFV
jgi:hypothetical protein